MYFSSFPVIPYDSKGDLQFKDVTNLLRRIGMRTKLKTNTFLYDTYSVKDLEVGIPKASINSCARNSRTLDLKTALPSAPRQ